MKNIIVLVITLMFSQCNKIEKKINSMSDHYKWGVETTGDLGYPMEILSGTFYDGKGEPIIGIQSEQILNQSLFGNSGNITVENMRPIPYKMDIRWFSFAEDQFYKGEFQLDPILIKKIFYKRDYQNFRIVPIPGGRVMLYAFSGNTDDEAAGSTELLGIYQGKEYIVTDFKKEMYIPDYSEVTREGIVKDYVKDMALQTQQEIDRKTISLQIWDNVSQRYPWKYTVEAIGWKADYLTMQKNDIGANYIDAEDAWGADVDYYTTAVPKPIPIEIDGKFETPAGRKFTIRIYPGNSEDFEFRKFKYEQYRMREQELVKQFKDFYEKIGKQEFEIHLRMSEDFKIGKVYLKKGDIMEEIPNTDVLIFDTTFGK